MYATHQLLAERYTDAEAPVRLRRPSDRLDLLALQRTAGNRAVAAALAVAGSQPAGQQVASLQRCGDELHAGCPCAGPAEAVQGSTVGPVVVQRGEGKAETNEEGAPTVEDAEETGVGELTCSMLPDAAVVRLVRAYFAARYPRASQHLVHYLQGSGSPINEDVATLFAENPRAAARVAGLIRNRGGNTGQLIGRTTDSAPVRQSDYDSEDWRLALGGIDEVDYEVHGQRQSDGTTVVRLSILDPYEWHPAEDRGTQCLHETMERQKQEGARDFLEQGTAEVSLQL